MQSISPLELKERLDAGEEIAVIDVRMDWELEVSSLPFAKHIALDELVERLLEIPKDQPVVMMCRSGNRSMQATLLLTKNGWQNVSNLDGGILAWAEEVDPSMPTFY